MAQARLKQLRRRRPISPEALAILHARHDYRAGQLPQNAADGTEAVAAPRRCGPI